MTQPRLGRSAEPAERRPQPAAASSHKPGKRRPGLLARCARPAGTIGRILAVVLPLLMLGAGIGYFRLTQGPVSVRFLVNPIERALNAELGGMRVDVDDAVLKLSSRGALELRLQRMRLVEPDGEVVAAAKSAEVELNSRALSGGRLAPSRITLIEPEIVVARTEQGQLSISFTGRDAGQGASVPPPPGRSQPGAQPSSVPSDVKGADSGPPALPSKDLAAAITSLMARLRSGDDAASQLESIGLRNAQLIVEGSGRRDRWTLPEVDVELKHRQKRSSLSLAGNVVSGGAPWSFTLKADEAEKAKSIRIAATFDGLVPRQTWPLLSGYHALEGVDIPLAGSGSLELSSDGQIREAALDFQARAGNLFLAWLDGTPMPIEGGSMKVRFDGESRRLEIAPSEIVSRDVRLVVAGHVVPDTATAAGGGWRFDLATREGTLESRDKKLPPLKIDRAVARGLARTQTGTIVLEELALKAGGADIAFTGEVGTEAKLEGRIGPMTIADLKTVWPVSVAPRARAFALASITKGQLKGGVVKVATAGAVDPAARKGASRQIALTMEAADIAVELKKEMPPVEVPRALLRVEGNALELSVPEAGITAGGGRKVAIRGGRLAMANIDQPAPVAEVTFRALGPLAAFLDIAERDPASPLKGLGLPLSTIEGKTDAQFKLAVPVGGGEENRPEVKVEGRVRVTDGRMKDAVGTYDISGATITVDMTDKGVDLKGEALLAGVHMRITGHQPAAGLEAKSLPLVISARLDNADRMQLGIDVESMVYGEVPVQLTLLKGTGDDHKLHLIADLTPAELVFDELAWRKPIGRPARLEFDIARRRQTKTAELQNFKLVGDNIAIDGWVGLGPDMKAREYYFPEFSLNVVTNLEVQGTRRAADNVWEIKALGKTLDASELYRALFAIGPQAAKPKRRNKQGVDLTAEIETVIGTNDTAMRQVKLSAVKRADQLVALDVRGTLDGGAPLSVVMQPAPGKPRTVQIDTADTGYAFKMIGFYPNMVGGRGRLDLNIDGGGAVEKAGRIRVRNYRILGDAIISEVFQNSDESRPAIAGSALPKRRAERESFEFESLDAQFAVGNGQVAIQQAVALGPLIGTSLKGSLDFRTQRMQFGGTYVPLSGLSRVIGQIPVLSQIFTGAHGEGVLGLTFAIEGHMANPQVIVNPISILAPGIFREIFQMAPENPRVAPRLDAASKGSDAVPQIRAATPAEARAARPPEPGEASGRPPGQIIDGWSTTETKGGKKR